MLVAPAAAWVSQLSTKSLNLHPLLGMSACPVMRCLVTSHLPVAMMPRCKRIGLARSTKKTAAAADALKVWAS